MDCFITLRATRYYGVGLPWRNINAKNKQKDTKLQTIELLLRISKKRAKRTLGFTCWFIGSFSGWIDVTRHKHSCVYSSYRDSETKRNILPMFGRFKVILRRCQAVFKQSIHNSLRRAEARMGRFQPSLMHPQATWVTLIMFESVPGMFACLKILRYF